MEPAQKRQRVAATTMQLVSMLPKELQAGVLMWAMEPTPTAAIMKAAIGDKHGETGWWADIVGKDHGHQKYLNRHTHCHRLWSRALEVRPDGSLAWKWSETNVFVNQTGRAHVRGVWADLQNEVAIRRNVRCEPPNDQYVESYGLARELRMHMPPVDLRGDNLETFVDICGYVIVNEPTDGGFQLQWGDAATRIAKILSELWHVNAQRRERYVEHCRHMRVLGAEPAPWI